MQRAPMSRQPGRGGPTGFFARLGDAVARYRWVVVGLWLAAFLAAAPATTRVAGTLHSGGVSVPDSDSGIGASILGDEFGRQPFSTGVVVFTSNTLTVDDPKYRDAVTSSLDRIGRLDGVKDSFSFFNTRNPRLVSSDRKTTYAILNYSADEDEAKKLTPDVRDQLNDQPQDIRAYLMGLPAHAYDLSKSSEHDLKKAELTSLPVTLILLLLVFGTILAAGLPLILGAAAVVVSLAGIYLIAQRLETSIFAMNTASMIGLGLGIDFSLLIVSRFREELDKGLSAHQATINTVATSGRSIVFSGLTVMLGLSVLCLYDLVLIRSIAIGMLLVAGVAVLGAVTLLPALMALFGRNLNAFRFIPARRSAGPGEEGNWHRWSMLVMSRPWVFLGLTLALLLALAWPARELYAIGTGGPQALPKEAETRQAYETLLDAFGAGEATPIQVLIRSPRDNGAWDPATLEGVYRLVKQVEADPRVQRVDSLVSLTPPGTSLEQFMSLTAAQLLGNPQAAGFVPLFVNVKRPNDSVDHRADIQYIGIFSRQGEINQDTIDLVKELRSNVIPAIRVLRSSEIHTSGQTAIVLDYRDKLFSQFPILVGLVLLVTYVVLLLFFHSLILPLKAILLNVISILASYGVLVLVFQHGFGQNLLDFESVGHLSMFSPVILFSILFGLSTDYEVFLLSRVKEHYAQSGDNERSVAMGLERTAGIITAAGLIMIVVFGSFALGGTLVIKELGVGLAVAVLLDSTVIRIVLVPASMKLMGAANWWMPNALDWIPQIKEGAELEAETFRSCPRCYGQLRATARFCGRCGTRLDAPAGVPAPVAVAAGPGQTMVDWGVAQPTRRGERGGALAAEANTVRLPVRLSNGRQQLRAWLVLRDCSVERASDSAGVPELYLGGVDLAPLSGPDPEIQIRNARIRM